MGCTQGKQQQQLKLQKRIQKYKSCEESLQEKRKNPELASTPTFNFSLQFELVDCKEETNYPTFRESLKKINKEENNSKSNSRIGQSTQIMKELDDSSEIQKQLQKYQKNSVDSIVYKVNQKVILDEIDCSSILKRRRNRNEFQYQM